MISTFTHMLKKLILFLLLACLFFIKSTAQKTRILSTYLSAQFNTTLKDKTIGNNPWGIGLGLQTYYNNRTKFKPTAEITFDVYLADDKVARVDTSGNIFDDVPAMANIFFGSSFHINKKTDDAD